MPLWLVYSLLAIVGWGIWGALGKALGDMSAGQSQAFSTLGILPVMLAVALSPGFYDSRHGLRGSINSLLAGLLVGAGNASYYQAVTLAKASTTVSFTMLYPIVTVILGLLLLRERPHPVQLAGIAGSLAAIYLLGVSRSDDGPQGVWLLYALACVVLWGAASLVMKVATGDISAAQSTFWFLGAFVPLAAWILIAQPRFLVDRPIQWNLPLQAWLVVIALGAAFGLGNLAVLAAYRHDGKASVVTPLAGLYPIMTIPLALVFFGETVGPREWAGIALAVVSAVAMMYEPKSAAAAPAAETF
ncbi:MAG: DMT family transporter [Planctomycetaceae bacterium]